MISFFPPSTDAETLQAIKCGAEIHLKYFKFHGLPVSPQELFGRAKTIVRASQKCHDYCRN